MSNQPEQENQQPEPVTPQELRQSILAELEASQQIIVQLNNEQLAEIVGGVIGKVPDNKLTPAQLWEQRERESQAAIIPIHATNPVSPTSPTTPPESPIVSRETSTVSPVLSRTSSATSSGSASSTQSKSLLHRWFIGCFTCG